MPPSETPGDDWAPTDWDRIKALYSLMRYGRYKSKIDRDRIGPINSWSQVKRLWNSPGELSEEAVSYWQEQAGREFDRGAEALLAGDLGEYQSSLTKSLAYYGAAAAADVAPKTVGGMFLDAVSLGRGTLTTKGALYLIRALRSIKGVRYVPGVTKTLDAGELVARSYSTPASKLFTTRKAAKLASLAARNRPWEQIRLPHREPIEPIDWSKLERDRPHARPLQSKSATRSERERASLGKPPTRLHRPLQRREPMASYSLIDPVKLASWSLETMTRQPKTSYEPFKPVTKRLHTLENRAAERDRVHRWVNELHREYNQGTFAHATSGNPWRNKQYGTGALKPVTLSSRPTESTLSSTEWRNLQRFAASRSRMSRPQYSDPLRAAANQLRGS
jgi:hypothetical protein